MSAAETIHAVCLVVGEAGILIRGPAGSGKTTLAARLVEEAQRQGRFACWVADDRVRLSASGGRLVARPHPLIAGRMELRHAGIAVVRHEPAAVVALVVDLVDGPVARLPEAPDQRVRLCGMALPRLACPVAAAPTLSLAGLAAARALAGQSDERREIVANAT